MKGFFVFYSTTYFNSINFEPKFSQMFREVDFEDIRPYYDHEINPALKRITSSPGFGKILDFIFPEKDHKKITDDLNNTYSALDFQKKFMYPLVGSIVKSTSNGLTFSGFEHLSAETPCLFVSNHRDIVLDSAILQYLLVDQGLPTTEITFGSNLMTDQFVIDFGKVNRMYKVYRGTNRSELIQNSKVLSAYIRYSIKEKKVSSWIAQRNGRTKDGDDRTETGLLKMFNISAKKEFHDSFKELNIVPVSISYEYEPCSAFKVNELLLSATDTPYIKKKGEDLQSIVTGITQQKGHIHISLCSPVNKYIDSIQESNYNAKIIRLAQMIDSDIYKNYKLWPTNYIAFDILHEDNKYSKLYTTEQKESFIQYMNKELAGFKDNKKAAEDIFLKIYSNPVLNSLK